jgi:hypothetical protein
MSQSQLQLAKHKSQEIKDIERRTITIIGASDVTDGMLPLCHVWALEVQLNGLETLASN